MEGIFKAIANFFKGIIDFFGSFPETIKNLVEAFKENPPLGILAPVGLFLVFAFFIWVIYDEIK